jgi:5-methylcytosine-specific restriction protein A
MNDPIPCGLCGRSFARSTLTKHHCLPRSRGGTSDDIALICSQCHGMVHATFTNPTLASLYPTIAELRRAPELAAYLKWVRKQPATRRKRNMPRRRKV